MAGKRKIDGRSGVLPNGITVETTVRKDGTERTVYKVSVSDEGKRYTLGRYEKLTDAKAARDIALGEIASRTFVTPGERRRRIREEKAKRAAEVTSVESWAREWLMNLEKLVDDGLRKGSTVVSYRSTLNAHILDEIGHVPLADVDARCIEGLMAKIPRKQPGARRNVMRTLRAMFASAVKAGRIPASPVPSDPGARKRKVHIDSEKVATPEQVKELAAAMPEEHRLMVLLAAWCAMRLGEVLGLQRRDFEHLDDPEKALVTIDRQWNSKISPPGYTTPKSGQSRTISVPPALVPVIVEHLDKHVGKAKTALVFRSPVRDDAPVSQTRFDLEWRAARKEVGMAGFRFHDLRHTGLTLYAQANATLAELLNRGGHSDVEVALAYQHATIERDRVLTALLPVVI